MPAPQGILIEPPIVLLTLDYAGQTFRLATEAVSITDASGVPHLYAGGLPALEVGHSIALFSESEPPSVDIECILDADVPLLIAQGHLLTHATAEIAIYRRGDRFEQRVPVIAGRVIDPRFTEADAAIKFVVTADPGQDKATWPDPDISINQRTMQQGAGSDYAQNDEGKIYPIVFGYPGVVTNSSGGTDEIAATPAYAIDGDSLGTGYGRTPRSGPPVVVSTKAVLLCYGWAWPQHVHCWNDTDSTEDNNVAFCKWIKDDVGNPITMLGMTLGDPLEAGWTLGDTFYVSWTTGSMFEKDGGSFKGAGQLMRYALERTSLTVDWARVAVAEIYLNDFHLAGFWDQPLAPWEWIRDNMLPILPISLVYGPDGIYPVVWRHWASSSDAVFAFVDGLNSRIEGEIDEEGSDDCASVVTLEYGYNARKRSYMRTAKWKAGDIVGIRQSGSSYLGPSALTEYGVDSAKTTQTDWVYEDNTANAILAWQVCAYAHPRRVVHLVSDGLGCGFLEHGDVVTITSSDRHLSGEVAHVRRAVWRGSQFLVDAVIFWRPSP